ncbi:MAG: helix-hairpin-helix domain-containing protein [Bacteroidota bacterium]|nr:helix-hairpin-helix domain-containing protein [Bacteroidota bacterium]
MQLLFSVGDLNIWYVLLPLTLLLIVVWFIHQRIMKATFDKMTTDRDTEIINLRTRNVFLESALSLSKSRQISLENDLAVAQGSIQEREAFVDVNPTTTTHPDLKQGEKIITSASLETKGIPSAALAKLDPENLQIIEGVGPKMEQFLHGMGISNWSQLASANAGFIKSNLEQIDSKFRIIDPESWPEQAGLARDGQWSALMKMQRGLAMGFDAAGQEMVSKLETILIKMGLLKKFSKDDLKAIEGIGPKIEKLLREAEIKSWEMLANAEVASLQNILDHGGDRYRLADPSSWPKQAELAVKSMWKEFYEYQDQLKQGKIN